MKESDMHREKFDELENRVKEQVERNVQRNFDKQFDIYKHLTTLSAGTIVILATFLSRPLGGNCQDDSIFFVLSFLAMIACVVIGYSGMMTVVSIQHWIASTMFPLFRLANFARKDSDLPTTNTMGHNEEDRFQAAEELFNSATRLESAIRRQRCLSLSGLITFLIGLTMLGLFIWKNGIK